MSNRISVGRIRVLVEQITTDVLVKANLIPSTNTGADLGTSAKRFGNLYVGDLHMQNDRGHYQIIEEEDCLTIRNHKNGKLYKFVLEKKK